MAVDALTSKPAPPATAPGTKVAPPKAEVSVAVENLTEAKPAAREAESAVHAAAKQIESYLKSIGRALEFRVDSDTGRTVVTVRNSATGEVVRQIPSEEALELARHLERYGGALVSIAV